MIELKLLKIIDFASKSEGRRLNGENQPIMSP
jgi:hypothetical protein